MSKRKFDQDEETTKKQKLIPDCPYISTVVRKLLDFDAPKICSVTLANFNVYGCLVCGKFFSGRGINTPAAKHSLLEDHHLFVNLNSNKIYCIPDDYEVEDDSLEDIVQNLSPKIDVSTLNKLNNPAISLVGQKFIPGYIGINNLKKTDYLSSVIQVLSKIPSFRDFLVTCNDSVSTTLLNSLSNLVKKVWNPMNFKNHVSPNDFINLVIEKGGNKYAVGNQQDANAFLLWLLNTIHEELCKSKLLTKSSPVTESFCGSIQVSTQIVPIKSSQNIPAPPVRKTFPFLTLSLDIPPMPLYKDKMDQNVIPQVPLFDLIAKYDGQTETLIPHEDAVEKKKFTIQSLPKCLIIHLKRFTNNQWTREKNHTIVKMPVKNLDLKEYCNIEHLDKTKYDLYGSICHTGAADSGVFKSHVYDVRQDVYYEIHDLEVKEIIPEEISISEAYILFYVRRE